MTETLADVMARDMNAALDREVLGMFFIPPTIIKVGKSVPDADIPKVILRAERLMRMRHYNPVLEIVLTYSQFDAVMRSTGTWTMTASEPITGMLFGMKVTVKR